MTRETLLDCVAWGTRFLATWSSFREALFVQVGPRLYRQLDAEIRGATEACPIREIAEEVYDDS